MNSEKKWRAKLIHAVRIRDRIGPYHLIDDSGFLIWCRYVDRLVDKGIALGWRP